jgi:hypothetical protein
MRLNGLLRLLAGNGGDSTKQKLHPVRRRRLDRAFVFLKHPLDIQHLSRSQLVLFGRSSQTHFVAVAHELLVAKMQIQLVGFG